MKHVPRLIFWELTKKCNLRCIHCRAEAEDIRYTGELDLDQVKRVVDDIAERYQPIMVLTGGEPLYRNDIFEIAAHVRNRGLRAALATNGTMITPSIAGSIRDAGIARVSISLDGRDAASHDGFRGIPGSYDAALAGARALHDAGVAFQFNTTVTRRNMNELEDIVSLAEREGAAALHIFMLVPVGCGVEIAESEMITKEQYEETLNWFYTRTKNAPIEFKATCAPHYYRIVRQRAAADGEAISFDKHGMASMTRGCLAGTGVCFISHRGDVQPCGYLPEKAGNVLETPFHEIWEHSPLFTELRDLDQLTGKCGVCEYRAVCAGCRARAYYETGSYLDDEPYCAYVPKKMRN